LQRIDESNLRTKAVTSDVHGRAWAVLRNKETASGFRRHCEERLRCAKLTFHTGDAARAAETGTESGEAAQPRGAFGNTQNTRERQLGEAE
jgi:hypothetical protein